jgi:hypothetical protein
LTELKISGYVPEVSFIHWFNPVFFRNVKCREIDLLILNRDYQQALYRIEQYLDKEPTAGLFFKKA